MAINRNQLDPGAGDGGQSDRTEAASAFPASFARKRLWIVMYLAGVLPYAEGLGEKGDLPWLSSQHSVRSMS